MAIQLPNRKISRTLPEQVGFNSEKIYEIIKWINDSDFIDKVLNLSDPSGTLTEAQYAIADLSPSYIVYGGKVFIKSLEDSDNIDFFKAGTDMSGSDSMIASVERVRVVKATKAYQYAVVQLFESYNKTQIDTLLAAKASLSGATFTGDVKAKTLEQTEVSWSGSLSYDSGLAAGLVGTPIFNSAKIINNILHLVICHKIENNSGETITINSGDLIRFATTTVPTKYAEKIYDIEGKNMTEGGNETRIIRSGPASLTFLNGGGLNVNGCLCEHYNTSLFFGFKFAAAYPLAAGQSRLLCAEMQLTLL